MNITPNCYYSTPSS